MVYFLNGMFRSFKSFLGLLGTFTGGSTLGFAVASSQPWYLIAGAALLLTESLFVLFDSSKVLNDIKKEIGNLKKSLDEFRQSNVQLKDNINQLEELKSSFLKETEDLQKTIEGSADQIDQLTQLKSQYVDANRQLKDQLVDQEEKNRELELAVDNLDSIKNKITQENQKLQTLLKQGQTQIDSLTSIRDKYLEENKRLESEVNDLSTNNSTLKEQVEKLNSLYQDSKKLLVNLATAGDVFQEFSSTIDTNLTKMDHTQIGLDQTAQTFKNLVEKLSQKKFEDFDLNNDGQITQEEFITGLQKMS